MSQTEKTNRLINEKSPYLLQHAHNPVDWYPWGDDAFDKAKTEDKPIFLSIGYSTCHWCHVMERESFEDAEVAQVLNEHFVAIKVDREERPDIDSIYMSVCQALTGHGGWPLTIVMTPDNKPFFAGTYFPKFGRQGMPGLMEILQQIHTLWQQERETLLESSEEITQALQQPEQRNAGGELTEETLHQAYHSFKASFDHRYGGFGAAPKFPTPHNLTFLLRYWKLTKDEKVLEIVEKTLEGMYLGGIYDHVGFGFCRYSTDAKWLVPHFEKMLYDNALLAIAYLEAFQATGQQQYARVAKEIFTYVLRDMTSPEGGFFSAEDADSEGEEGKFYLWDPEEVKKVLGPETGKDFCETYDITPRGNFEGKSIPNLIKSGWTEDYAQAGNQLFLHRQQRVHPFKDDKLLTGWNGLMIAALALGSRVLAEETLGHAAERAAQFIQHNLRTTDGRLLARYRQGHAAYKAYADDYAFLIWGLIELYETTFEADYLSWALELNQDLIKYFWDETTGGLFQYGSDAEQLITRPKELYDGALPSANSVATLNFLRLAKLTDRQELATIAEQQFKFFAGTASEYPAGYTYFLMAAYFNLVPTSEVTIVGNLTSEDTQELLTKVNSRFLPEVLLIFKAEASDAELEQLLPATQNREAINGKATAYVCQNFTCQKPTTDPGELGELLQ